MTRSAWILLPALALAACQSLQRGAKEQFSKDVSCPVDLVESRERPDLHSSSFEAPSPGPQPPAAVAADPARLAVWRQNHTRDATASDGLNDIYEARGCDTQAFYKCHHPSKHALQASCSRVTSVPPGISHW